MKKVSVFLMLLTMGLLMGCYKEVSFDVKPAIEFKELRKIITFDDFLGKKDSLIITIKFKDGDGDLGYAAGSELEDEVKKNNFNYLLKSFRKKQGVFQEYVVPGVTYSGYIVPRLNGDKKSGPIEGTLDFSVDFPQNFVFPKDSLKFQIAIKDRAGNLSNTVESSIIVLNEF